VFTSAWYIGLNWPTPLLHHMHATVPH